MSQLLEDKVLSIWHLVGGGIFMWALFIRSLQKGNKDRKGSEETLVVDIDNVRNSTFIAGAGILKASSEESRESSLLVPRNGAFIIETGGPRGSFSTDSAIGSAMRIRSHISNITPTPTSTESQTDDM